MKTLRDIVIAAVVAAPVAAALCALLVAWAGEV
jgi:hypothetical protein